MSITTKTTGWPTDHGPMRTLNDLGIIPAGTRPNWLNYPKVIEFGGHKTYKASAKFLKADGIRALAALTFEGWDVALNYAPGELDIKVTETHI